MLLKATNATILCLKHSLRSFVKSCLHKYAIDIECLHLARHRQAMGRSINTRQGSVHLPLLKIPVNHFVLDEPHLLLRIFDVLFDNLMALATMLDNAARDGSHKYVEGLATAVRECGVTFHIWKDKEGGDKCKYTSLTGNGMKKGFKGMCTS